MDSNYALFRGHVRHEDPQVSNFSDLWLNIVQ